MTERDVQSSWAYIVVNGLPGIHVVYHSRCLRYNRRSNDNMNAIKVVGEEDSLSALATMDPTLCLGWELEGDHLVSSPSTRHRR